MGLGKGANENPAPHTMYWRLAQTLAHIVRGAGFLMGFSGCPNGFYPMRFGTLSNGS